MKQIVLALILLVTISLTSCNLNPTTKSANVKLPKDVTVKHVTLTQQEKDIAKTTSDNVEKFIFEKDKVYDIEISYYHDGKIFPQQAMYGMDSKGKSMPVILSRDILFEASEKKQQELWRISYGEGLTSFPIDFLPLGESYNSAYGIGKESFKMERGKEYLLHYVAYKKGNSFRTRYPIFGEWDTTENKLEQLKEFDYVLLFTTKISDTPGYK